MVLCLDIAKGKIMDDFACSVPISTLICHEHQAFSINEDEFDDDEMKEAPLLKLPYAEEYIEILVTKETSSEITNFQFLHCNWLRSEAIRWMLKMTELFGFSPQTLFQSVSYFDRFLMRRGIESEKSWVVQLLSVACLSLAAKMEEITAPSLTEYQTEKCYFDGNTIQRMELFVLSTLEWRMSSVVPHAYLDFFAVKFYGKNFSAKTLSRTTAFIFSVLEEINLVEFRASVIAAAAVLATFDLKLTRQAFESKMKSVSFFGFIETELVYSCYNLMTWQSKKRPRAFDSSDSSEFLESVIDNFDDISDCASLAGNSSKRKRLQQAQID